MPRLLSTKSAMVKASPSGPRERSGSPHRPGSVPSRSWARGALGPPTIGPVPHSRTAPDPDLARRSLYRLLRAIDQRWLSVGSGTCSGRAVVRHSAGLPDSAVIFPRIHLRNCDACKPGAVGDVTPRYRCTRRCACPDSPPIGPFASSRALKGGTTHLLAVRRRVSGRASTSLSTARRSAAGSASTLFSRLRRRAVFGDVPSFIGFTPSSSSVVTRSAWAGLALSQRQLCARATTRIACPSPVDGDSAAQQCRWYVARKPG